MSLFSPDKTTAEDGHINVLAQFLAKPEHAASIQSMLMDLVEPTRKEDGCKDYHLLCSKENPAQFYTYESWESEAHLQQHLDGAKPTLARAEPMLISHQITILNHLK